MYKKLILKIATLSVLVTVISSCSTLFEAYTGINLNGPGKRYEQVNGTWVEVKPREPDSFDLELQKTLLGDVLVGNACDGKFSFEIQIIASNGDYAGNKAYYDRRSEFNSMTNGDLYQWAHAFDTLRGSALVQNQLMAILNVKYQNSQVAKTELVANMANLRRGQGLLTFYSYYVPAGGKRITVEEAQADKLRALRLDIVKNGDGTGWAGTIEGENLSACLDLTLKSKLGRSTNNFAAPYYPYSDESAMDMEKRSRPPYGVLGGKINPEIQIFWTKKYVETHPEESFLLGSKYEDFGKTNPSYYPHALKYLLIAAEQYHDFRAYRSLSLLYEQGHVKDADHSKAKYWRNRFVDAYRPANEICSDPKVREIFSARELRNKKDKILVIYAAYFKDLHHYFECTAIIKRHIEHQDVSLFDKDDEDADDPLASILDIAFQMHNVRMEEMMRKPYVDFIKVYPNGDGRYILSNGTATLGFVTYKPRKK